MPSMVRSIAACTDRNVVSEIGGGHLGKGPAPHPPYLTRDRVNPFLETATEVVPDFATAVRFR